MKTYQIAVILAVLAFGLCAFPASAQTAIATTVGGSGNSAVAVNDQGGSLNFFQNQYNTVPSPSVSVINENDIMFPSYTQHDGIDLGAMNESWNDISPRMGMARVFDIDDNVAQTAGMQFTFTFRSADPVLVYGINANDKDLAMSTSSAPILDDAYTGHYTHGQLTTYLGDDYKHNSLGGEDLSTKNSATFTIPSDGFYAFVVDDRVTDSLDGTGAHLQADTYDLAYTITYDGIDSGFKFPSTPPMIGTISMCPVGSDGRPHC